MPAKIPEIRVTKPIIKIKNRLFKRSVLPVRLVKTRSKGPNAIRTKKIAITAKISDSPKNWKMIFFLNAPKAFLIPISLALFMERTVERFMKLTEAIIRINIPIIKKR